MIVPSEFDELIAGGLDPVVVALQQTFNGENVVPGYSFRADLTRRYSIDGTYKTMGVDNGLIAADIIALDSPLPVKERPTISSGGGEIAKIGTELPMNETELKQLRLLMRAGGDLAQVRALLFSDVRRVYGGVLEQIEWRHLQGQSQGFFVADTDNVGLGVRVDYGYRAENQYDASIVWGQPNYTALTDLIAVYNAAADNGIRITRFRMNTATKNLLLASADSANFLANFNGALNNGTRPTMTRFNEATQTEYGFVIEEINRSVTYQINGVKTTIQPWVTGQVVGLPEGQFGSLIWSDVEEMSAPVGGVNYSRAEEFILISQYRTARPSLKQWTGAQAVALPIINGFNIVKLDTTTAATT